MTQLNRLAWITCLLLFGIGTGCNTTNNNTATAPPDPTYANITLLAQPGTSSDPYKCGAGAPGWLVSYGNGSIKANVTSNNAVNFVLDYEFQPVNFNFPIITPQNGTTTATASHNKIFPGGSSSANDDFELSVPVSDSYKIKVFYIEYGISSPGSSTGNTSSCSNPSFGKCYRWIKMMDFASGSHPNGTIFSVDIKDPSGFEGNCS